MPSLLVVRIRGTVNIRYDVKETLRLLRLWRRYSATIIPENDYYLGMLKVAKDQIAWGVLDFETAKLLLTKRGKFIGNKAFDDSLAKAEGFESVDKMIGAIVDGQANLSRFKTIKPYFSLAPPKGGFKRSTKKPYNIKGVLGKNKELMALVSRMI